MQRVNYSKAGFYAAIMLILVMILPGLSLAQGPAKNVIVLIPDGCSFEQYTLARWFKGAPLTTDSILTGAVKTYIADSVIADSAPAATAYATGTRTNDKYIGLSPDDKVLSTLTKPSPDMLFRPMPTVLEAARLMAKSTGLVATSRVSHATPASFAAHVSHRKYEEDIMEQMVYQGIDVVFGGGGQFLFAKENQTSPYHQNLTGDPHSAECQFSGNRADKENLAAVLKSKGYKIVCNKDEMEALKEGRVFGLFANGHLAAELDRPSFAPSEPTLEEMTVKAIELLSKNPNGFFLMVEGSQVDWACHANDPAHMIHDLLMFDKAVAVALEFAKKQGDTLVLAMPDHNTGGMSIGNYATSKSYPSTKVEELLEPLKKLKLTTPRLLAKAGKNPDPEKIKEVVKEFWSVDITDDEAKTILARSEQFKDDPNFGFGEVISPKYFKIGWTTHGHCGGDVPLAAYGPGKPGGLLDAPEIARVIAAALGTDLAPLRDRLFMEAGQAFEGGTVTVDQTDKFNPVIKIDYKGRTAELPANKNLIKIGSQISELEGVVVYLAETGKAYLPRQAVEMVRNGQ
ncbi:MAG: alkaline phosphatase [Deltaproteobacteria bacterium]|nr:alkaline phosphatase [Deltaproteobacteria bacterium]